MSNDLDQVKTYLAHNIAMRRKALGISQEKLALDSDVDRTYVSQLERKVANPSLAILCRMAQVLDCELVTLLSKPEA